MQTSWDYRLVALSVVIAIIGSYIALAFALRMKAAKTLGYRQFWFLSGAITMGFAVWSMHFVGMLALIMPMPVSYDPALSMLSMFAAAMGAGFAFFVMDRKLLSSFHWVAGALAMGLAIVSMHYIGMASMQMPVQIEYDPLLFVLSVLIAISASAGALWLAFHFQSVPGARQLMVQKIGSAMVMGGAISGMHYTGMAAARYIHVSRTVSGFEVGAASTVGPFLLSDLIVLSAVVFGFLLLLLNYRAITERDQALSELHDREALFSTLFNQAGVGIAQTDLSGKILLANQRFYEITGLAPPEPGEESKIYVHELFYPQMLETVISMLRAAVEQRKPIVLEEQCLRPDNKQMWVVCHATPITPDNVAHQPAGLIVVIQDITERRLAEADLAETQERFRLLVEEVKDYAIYWLDPDGDVVSWNRGAERIFGYSSDEVTGRSFSLFFPEIFPEGMEKPMALLARSVQEGRLELELPQKKRNNRLFEAHMTITPIWDEHQALVGFSNITRDITVEKKTRQDLLESHQVLQTYVHKLEQSNQELEQFAMIASHDLQTPLRKVMIYSNALHASLEGNLSPDAENYLERLQKATQHMQELITDLLALSRVTRKGGMFKQILLSDVVRDVLLSLEDKIRQEGARIEVNGVVSFEGDPVQIRQLLQNLLENALKFHIEGHPPFITIHARVLDENLCEIAVQDNGIGFDEKYLDRIFAVFERLHSDTEYEGTGMGLAIARKIVERHGGTITAKSQPNLGSTFNVTLPIRQMSTAEWNQKSDTMEPIPWE